MSFKSIYRFIFDRIKRIIFAKEIKEMKKAEAEVKYRITLLQLQDENPFQECDVTPHIITDCTKVYKFYAQQNYNTNGFRYAFVILKQVLE